MQIKYNQTHTIFGFAPINSFCRNPRWLSTAIFVELVRHKIVTLCVESMKFVKFVYLYLLTHLRKRKKMIGYSFYRKLDKSNLPSDLHFDKILTKLAKFIDDNPFWWIWPRWFRLCFTCLTCGLILNFKTRWLRIVIFVKLLRHINVALCVNAWIWYTCLFLYGESYRWWRLSPNRHQSHYLNQWWVIVDWTSTHFNQYHNYFSYEKEFQNTP